MLFSLNLLKRHSLSLTPPDAPDAFFWTIENPARRPCAPRIRDWTDEVDTAYREGRLKAPS